MNFQSLFKNSHETLFPSKSKLSKWCVMCETRLFILNLVNIDNLEIIFLQKFNFRSRKLYSLDMKFGQNAQKFIFPTYVRSEFSDLYLSFDTIKALSPCKPYQLFIKARYLKD